MDFLFVLIAVPESRIFQLIKPFNKVMYDSCMYQNTDIVKGKW